MTYSKDELFERIKHILEEQFDVDADAVMPQADLRDDLDIDSIDAVNLMIELKTITGKKIALESFQSVRTVDDLVGTVHQLLLEDEAPVS